MAVRDGLLVAIATLPAHLRKSLTWDQGSEMARHSEITLASKMSIYSVIRIRRGSVGATRTPTGCSGSISRKVPICQCTARAA